MAGLNAQQLIATTAAALASGVALAYTNEKYAVSHDVNEIYEGKAFEKAINQRLQQLGQNCSLYRVVELAESDNEALWFEGRTWTFAQLRMETDKIATLLHRQGIGEKEVVALFATNSPEFIFVLCALAKLGAIAALINTSLRSQTLAHCVKLVNAQHMVCTPDLVVPLSQLSSETDVSLPTTVINLSSFPPAHAPVDSPIVDNITNISYADLASITPADYQPQQAKNCSISDTAFYMFTSGTSGKPKAVNFRLFGTLPTGTPLPPDTKNPRKYLPVRTYVCLPLFHATGLLLGVHYSWCMNGACCISRRFSARRFSKELYDSKATRMMYVGELTRYLLKAPPSEYDRKHKVIVACGNGMQADVWNKFRARYGIAEIREFYRSTEGVASFDLRSTRVKDAGHVGRTGPLKRKFFEDRTYIVRYDRDKEEPWRDPKTGFCVEASTNEPGEVIGRVTSMATYREYLNNPEANAKKLIKNVFREGDLFQRTGDLLVRDSWQMVKFADRTGDTYRWNGENVSAGEVREHVSKLPDVREASVYAVKLEGYDGQAGAAGITLGNNSSEAEQEFMAKFFTRLRKNGLTTWQMPRLVRLTDKIETTATFKQLTSVLKQRSWDPEHSQGDRLYWLDGETFKRLDTRAWNAIKGAKVRL